MGRTAYSKTKVQAAQDLRGKCRRLPANTIEGVMAQLRLHAAKALALAGLLLAGIGASAALASPGTPKGDPPPTVPGSPADDCSHGNSGKDCKPDPQPDANGTEYRICHGRCDSGERRFAGPHGRLIFAIDQDDFYLRHIAEAWYTIFRQVRVQNAAVLEMNGFKQRAAESLHDGPGNLIFESLWIHNRAAIKCLDHAYHFDFFMIHRNFGASGDIAALLEAAGNSKTPTGGARPLSPSELVGRTLEHSAEAFVF